MIRGMRSAKNKRENPPPCPAPQLIPPYYDIYTIYYHRDLYPFIGLNIYVWLYDGREFWMYPVFIKNDFLCGYIWVSNEWQKTCICISDIKGIF